MANCTPAENNRLNAQHPREDRLIAKMKAGDCSVLPELNGLLGAARAIYRDTERRIATGNNPQHCWMHWKSLPTVQRCGCKDVNHLYVCSGSTQTAAAKPPTEHPHAAPQPQPSTSANQQSGSCSDVTGLGGGGPPINCSTQNGSPGLPGNKPVTGPIVTPPPNKNGSPSDQEVAAAAMDEILNGMNQPPTPAPVTPAPAPQTTPTPPASAQPNPACKPFYSASPAKEAELYMIAGAAAEQYRTCADWSAAQGNYLNAAKYYACIGNDAQHDVAQAKADALGAAVDAVEAKNQCNQFAGQAPQPAGDDNPYRGPCSLTAGQLQEVLTYMTKVADVENEEYPSEIATAIEQKFGRGCPVPTLRTCLEARLHDQSAPGCRSPAKPSPVDNQ
jgi:hypothetical protein